MKGKRLTREQFIGKSQKVHGNKYDYSKVEYINNRTKVCIICPIHGEFWQTPAMHLQGQGCSKCKGNKLSMRQLSNVDEFIEKAKKLHGDRYDYSRVTYVNGSTEVRIVCPIHGEFLQTPNSHLQGHGCPNCQNSILENNISNLLKIEHIEYEEKKCFKWLGKQHLDFYLPEYNIGIECQGEQHFISKEHFGGDIGLNTRKKLDKKKYDLCCENGIKIIYYTDNLKRKKMFDENIIHNNNDLIKIINNGN